MISSLRVDKGQCPCGVSGEVLERAVADDIIHLQDHMRESDKEIKQLAVRSQSARGGKNNRKRHIK